MKFKHPNFICESVIDVNTGRTRSYQLMPKARQDERHEPSTCTDLLFSAIEKAAKTILASTPFNSRPYLSVPVRVSQLIQPNFFSDLQSCANTHLGGLKGLQLEISESELPSHKPSLLPVLYRYTAQGAALAARDVVAGNENFATLTFPPITTIKFAPMVARSLNHSKWITNAVRGFGKLAKELGKDVVLTGVEKDTQYLEGLDVGVTLQQGIAVNTRFNF